MQEDALKLLLDIFKLMNEQNKNPNPKNYFIHN